MNDDRLGRALDAVGPGAEDLRGRLLLRTIDCFRVDAGRLHLDLTAVRFPSDQRGDIIRGGVELGRSMFPHLDEGVSSGDFGPHVEDTLNMIEGLSDDQRSRIREMLLDNAPNLKPERLGFLMQEESMEPPVAERLTEVEAPTLVVLAASEEEAAQRVGLGLVLDEVPNVEKAVVSRGSFCLALEDPEQLNEVPAEFLGPPHQ